MNKGIEYNDIEAANALCNRLLPCKDLNDSVYSTPIKKHDEEKYFVQVLNEDLVHLTPEEFANLIDFPNDYFISII